MTLPDYLFIYSFLFYQAIDVREGKKAKTRDKRRDAHRLENMNKKFITQNNNRDVKIAFENFKYSKWMILINLE